ncbi:hypothetical protein BDP27DRAFT_1429527 [Rhodocollybia butyracea]|uniref:Uncharacterized protein n=1 Tax=Rhodocollybia butyracea TaxID=206335 RepID=A0A9P5PEW6_9AGAR|nr:hypothetical protein BDP27DRAFT_1429527 [Rhodocollybia butyracea]
MPPANLLKRFHPHDASFDRDTRPKRTHTDDALTARIAKLSTSQKIQFNHKIILRNEAHQQRAVNGDEDVSDVKSLANIDDEEYNSIKCDLTIFEMHKKFLPPKTVLEMIKANKEDAETKTGSSWSRQRAPDNDDSEVNVFEPEDDIALQNLKHIFPLHLFHPKNLDFINLNIHRFKRAKAVGEKSTKVHILDIDDISAMIKEEGRGPVKEDEMDYNDWRKAFMNLHEFETHRYKDGEDAARPKFLQSHASFFDGQEDADKKFQVWFPYKCKLCQKHYDHKVAFDMLLYTTTWSEISLTIKMQEQIQSIHRQYQQNLSGSNSSSIPSSSKAPRTLKGNAASSSNAIPLSSTRPPPPFQQGNAKKVLPSHCGGCGRRGHGLGDESADHGPFPYATYASMEIATKVAWQSRMSACFAAAPIGLENITLLAPAMTSNPFTNLKLTDLLDFHNF